MDYLFLFTALYQLQVLTDNIFICSQIGQEEQTFRYKDPINSTAAEDVQKCLYVTVRKVVKETRTISRAKAMHRRGFRSNGNVGNKKNAYLGLKASAAAYCNTRIGGGAAVSTATRRNVHESFGCTNLIHCHLEIF